MTGWCVVEFPSGMRRICGKQDAERLEQNFEAKILHTATNFEAIAIWVDKNYPENSRGE